MEIQYCHDHGLAPSVFRTWPDDDQDAVLAWALHQRVLCQMCGTIPAEWIGEDQRPIEPPPYRVATRKCFGCVALEEERKKIYDAKAEGILPYLERNRG